MLIALAVVPATAGALTARPIPSSHAEPEILSGRVTLVNRDGTAFIFSTEPGLNPSGTSYEATFPQGWDDVHGEHHADGLPDCIRPGSDTERRAKLSLVYIGRSAGRGPIVVGIHCLD